MTKIEWAQEVWNWHFGCTKVSAGCQNCYAEKMAKRLIAMGQENYERVIGSDGKWNGQFFVDNDLFSNPQSWKKPRMIFVNSMSDTFHESVSASALNSMFRIIDFMPEHIFIILTKRPEIALMASQSERLGHWFGLPNLWLGVTAENQEMANKRIPILLQIPAAKRFVSIEPMLGPVKLFNVSGWFLPEKWWGKSINLDWVICGSESGPSRRPFDEDWARSLRDQCFQACIPFFYKQRYIGNKKFSMPLLDGKTWNQIPER